MNTRITLTKNQRLAFAALVDASEEWMTADALGVPELALWGLRGKGIASRRGVDVSEWSLTMAGRFVSQFPGPYR